MTKLRAQREAADRDLRFRLLVQRLHRLGPQPLYHLLDRIACRFLARSWLERELEDLTRLNPETVKALSADQLPTPPLRAIRGGRR